MTNIKLVENTKNTEILDNLIEEYNKTIIQLINFENSVCIHRKVQPDEENFQNVKNAINTLLGIKMKKERGSLKLIETNQEIILVPDNDEEKFKIDVLKKSLLRIGGTDILSETNLEDDSLNKLFSESTALQGCIVAGEYDPSIQGLNLINPFVTEAYFSEYNIIHTHRAHSVEKYRENTCTNLFGGWRRVQTIEKGDYELIARRTNISYAIDWDFDDIDWDFDDVDAINAIPTEELTKHVDEALMDLEGVNCRLNAYIKDVSMPASEFFELLPDATKTELDALLEKAKEKQIRISQLVRKTVNVDLSFNMDIELDSLGDIEDMKKIILETVQSQLALNIKFAVGLTSGDIDIKSVENVKTSSVQINSEMKEVA